ncbi:hypothetical protein BWQ96_08336 [Gracilariopsis chorda]|uniref:Uncharacterized protein n=1 Tax=Gracilariopsis chorda TaxID=448386 RepID=A0A2V3IIK7_9FLOR|nr:hypothetical protein BWQ96_08336 [Gracilariopsis chorda]|eukprot:PXF41926.1 hypothetical protein BWQ96_08336 [Gracilariopsis chorda]
MWFTLVLMGLTLMESLAAWVTFRIGWHFEYRPSLVAAKTDMEKRLRQYAGASVEDNTLSVSFHYRKCEGDQIGAIESFVNGVAKQHDLALTRGKNGV